MSLADRLKNADKRRGKISGCASCRWLDQQPPGTLDEVEAWINDGHAKNQLHEFCREEGLTVGLSAFLTCLRKCRGYK